MGVGGTPKFGFSQKDPGFERFRSILDDPQNLSKKYYVSSAKWSNEVEVFFLQTKKLTLIQRGTLILRNLKFFGKYFFRNFKIIFFRPKKRLRFFSDHYIDAENSGESIFRILSVIWELWDTQNSRTKNITLFLTIPKRPKIWPWNVQFFRPPAGGRKIPIWYRV